jgi:alcohol dehydrogenase class IV
MVHSFLYEALPARVIFATLSAALLTEEMARIGMKRPIVLATPLQEPQAREIAAMLDEKSVGVFAGAVMHTPVEITEKALSIVREAKADGVVAIGGGSTTGLSKAIALRTDLPQLVIPTTYAGSEMTPILGETANGVKRTQTTRKVLPETVIYDVELTLGLPPALSAASGLNAIAHAVEAMYARDRNPIVSMMAEEGIRSLFAALPLIVKKPSDLAARSDALYGAWLCGVCLGSVGMALHHKLCHTLGGTFNLPHAETHAIVLPHALAYNTSTVSDIVERLARALGTGVPASKIYQLSNELGIGGGLRTLGMPEDGIDQAADLAIMSPYWNPRPIERDAVRELIARAWAGEPPRP